MAGRAPLAARAVALWRRAAERPVLTVAAVALTARAIIAVVSWRAHVPVLIPDESLYLSAAAWLSDGGSADSWSPGYGDYFLRSTAAFTVPLWFAFEVVGVTRTVGQAIAGVYGAVAAALAVGIGCRVVPRTWALGAGLVVALVPSQVLHASVVLRESATWTAIALVLLGWTFAVDPATTRRRELAAGALATAGLLLLAVLRDQTLVVVGWSLVVAALIAGRPGRRWHHTAAALVLAVAVPAIGGVGAGGVDILRGRDLAEMRTTHALEADSAFAPRVTADDVATPGGEPVGTVLDRDGDSSIVAGGDGRAYEVDTSLGATIRAVPTGVVAFLLRPFPWQGIGDGSLSLRLAGFESPLWYLLYAAGVVGALRVRRNPALVLPLLTILAIVGAAAVSQGNLGTAFRHRQQLLVPLAVLAATGAAAVVERRRQVGARGVGG